MTKSTHTVVLVVLGLFGLGALGAGAVALVLVGALGGLGGSTDWSESALPERELPSVFGVRLPVKPLRYQGRSLGFQDGYFEVLVQLPAGAAEVFLSSNKLIRGEKAVMDPDVIEQLRTIDQTTPALEATRVELPEALKADGGVFNLTRSGELLEAPGVLWVHLTAFET
jgi:hypothetical protein